MPTEWDWAALSSFCFNEDCYVSQAFKWNDGVLTDLGAILDGISSQANWISPNGLITRVSENGEFDPLISGFPEFRAVLWRNRSITDLGTSPQGYESSAYGIKGQVIGWALNTVPDPYSMIAPGFATTQTRAFLWQNGVCKT